MQAIETTYRGYRFRSRTEARWAVFFDALGIKWEYEQEGYQFADGTRYLPDFWLPEFDGGLFVEVKGGNGFDDETFAKAIRLTDEGRRRVLCLWGTPAPVAYRLLMPPDDCLGWDDVGVCFNPKYLPGGSCEGENRLYICADYTIEPSEQRCDGRVEDAINAARSARFEFGQSGAGR